MIQLVEAISQAGLLLIKFFEQAIGGLLSLKIPLNTPRSVMHANEAPGEIIDKDPYNHLLRITI